jgi:glycosyltransferase involved in cell wall biosynthesis
MNNPTPKISLIVPVYNVENYIHVTLQSILKQSYENWEAILVDDGSLDNSGNICDKYASQDLRFKVIHKPNGGLSSARNTALKHITGEYIFYLDGDDFIHHKTLEQLLRIAQTYNADIVQCDFVFGTAAVFPEINESEAISVYDNRTVFTHFATKVLTWGKLYRRSVVGDVQFPEGLVHEDDFTTWKFYYRANSIAVTSVPYYYYTCNPCSIMAKKEKRPDFLFFNAYRERIKFFHEHNEVDLEAVSIIQWLKSLVLLFNNPSLSSNQKKEILAIFNNNDKSLRRLPYKLPIKWAIVFRAFKIAPALTGRIAHRIYNKR